MINIGLETQRKCALVVKCLSAQVIWWEAPKAVVTILHQNRK
jgi:hypothetical protein